MFHSDSLLSQEPLACESSALPSVLFMLKLHIYFIYTYETEMLQERITKYKTHIDLHWYFSKVNLCSVLSNSNSIYKHYT